MKVFLLVILISLAGCTEKIIYRDRIVMMYPDDAWTVPVEEALPPAKVTGTSPSVGSRIQMCGNAYIAQTTQVRACNLQLDKIEQWKIQHQREEAKSTEAK